MLPKPLADKGFTLVELIIVITLTGIVGVMVAAMSGNLMQGYVDLERRAELTDLADTALRRMASDIRSAIPNSIRVSGDYMEMVLVEHTGRYRSSGSGNVLQINKPTDGIPETFEVYINESIYDQGDDIATNNMQAIIYNLGDSTPISLYKSGSGVRSGSVTAVNDSNKSNGSITVTIPDHTFVYGSPSKRVYFSKPTAVTYFCDEANNRVVRYDNYAISTSGQPTSAAALSSANSSILVDSVGSLESDCEFLYQSSSTLAGLGVAVLKLTLKDHNDTVTLAHQVRVLNVP